MKTMMGRFAQWCLVLGVMGASSGVFAQSGQINEPALDIELKPLPEVAGGKSIGTIEATLRFSALNVPTNTSLVSIALVTDNVDTIATVVKDLAASDAQGPLKLTWHDVDLPVEHARDSEAGGRTREWFADRTVHGPVTVTYSFPGKASLPPRGTAGPLDFRNDDAGVSGNGNVFLLLPKDRHSYAVRVDWDLSALPKGARGISSLGEGADAKGELTLSNLGMSYFMAGMIGGLPDPVQKDAFFAAWQGTPPFDVEGLMQWTRTLHEHYRKFFGESTPHPYGVFLRYNPANAGGGTGFFRSFVATYGPGRGSSIDELKMTLAHEMFHTFQPYITKPAGKESSWFGEGLAMVYEHVLPYRYGMITSDDFIKDVNFYAMRLYSNVLANLPNSEVAPGFWKDTRVRSVAYDRGMLYFITVDEAVRKASAGRMSLDDLMMEMLHRGQKQGGLVNADWEDVVRSELGQAGVDDFHAFMAGTKIPLPSADAFGPCFTRTTETVRRYQLGFDPAVLSDERRIVRGLIKGSAAEQAGLRNGDEITKPVAQDQIQGDQTEILKLDIRRGDQSLHISYLPRGEKVEVYQWQQKASMEGVRCAL